MQTPEIRGGPEESPVPLRACIVDDHAAVREWLTGKLDSLGVAYEHVAELGHVSSPDRACVHRSG